MKKKNFRVDRVVTVVMDLCEEISLYPTGESEFKECVDSWVSGLWSGECTKVIAEYNTLENGTVVRHSMVYTEYGKEPEVSSKVIG